MAGAKDLVARGRTAGVDGVICCEPEGGEICHVAKGALRLRLDFTGKMAHGAMPFQGRNPNRAVGAAIGALAELEAAVQERHGEHPHLGQVWITPTVLRAGEPVQMNVMPAGASVWVDVRTIPSVDHAALVAELDRRRRRGGARRSASRTAVDGDRRPPERRDRRGRPAGARRVGRPRRGRRRTRRASAACPAPPTAR